LNLVDRLAASANGVFPAEEHTHGHWREQLWILQLLARDGGAQEGPDRHADCRIIDQAEGKWRDAPASYRRPDLDQDKIKAAEEVLARAKRHLLK
jgi:hypothetical protein